MAIIGITVANAVTLINAKKPGKEQLTSLNEKVVVPVVAPKLGVIFANNEPVLDSTVCPNN